jgi:hypothetical protein
VSLSECGRGVWIRYSSPRNTSTLTTLDAAVRRDHEAQVNELKSSFAGMLEELARKHDAEMQANKTHLTVRLHQNYISVVHWGGGRVHVLVVERRNEIQCALFMIVKAYLKLR